MAAATQPADIPSAVCLCSIAALPVCCSGDGMLRTEHGRSHTTESETCTVRAWLCMMRGMSSLTRPRSRPSLSVGGNIMAHASVSHTADGLLASGVPLWLTCFASSSAARAERRPKRELHLHCIPRIISELAQLHASFCLLHAPSLIARCRSHSADASPHSSVTPSLNHLESTHPI